MLRNGEKDTGLKSVHRLLCLCFSLSLKLLKSPLISLLPPNLLKKIQLSKFRDLIGFIQQLKNLAACYLAVERSSEGHKAEKGQEKEIINKECIVLGNVSPLENRKCSSGGLSK